MTDTTILIRADASETTGTGHVLRCLSLADALQRKGCDILFVMCESVPAIEKRIREAGCAIQRITEEIGSAEDAKHAGEIAAESGAQWVVVDGYSFGSAYIGALKKQKFSVLMIDDYGQCDQYDADIVLNQNVSAQETTYAKRADGVKLLLGPSYALLGPKFTKHKRKQRTILKAASNVLVTLGGADPQNITLKVLRALERVTETDFAVTVIVGGANAHRREIETAAAAMRHTVTVETDVSDMPKRMEDADLAIAAGGTTTYELLSLGVPFITGAFADNQRTVADALGKQDLAENIGWYPTVDEKTLSDAIRSLANDHTLRTARSKRAMQIVDGNGADRVAAVMLSSLTIRNAVKTDAKMLFAWANDPGTRTSSFSPEAIAWEDHVRWFEAKLADDACRIYIGEHEGTPVGQIRFDRDGDLASIDIHTAPDLRGKGYGTSLIMEGVRIYFAQQDVERIEATVKTDNDASRKVFEKAGFIKSGTDTENGHAVYRFILHRP